MIVCPQDIAWKWYALTGARRPGLLVANSIEFQESCFQAICLEATFSKSPNSDSQKWETSLQNRTFRSTILFVVGSFQLMKGTARERTVC